MRRSPHSTSPVSFLNCSGKPALPEAANSRSRLGADRTVAERGAIRLLRRSDPRHRRSHRPMREASSRPRLFVGATAYAPPVRRYATHANLEDAMTDQARTTFVHGDPDCAFCAQVLAPNDCVASIRLPSHTHGQRYFGAHAECWQQAVRPDIARLIDLAGCAARVGPFPRAAA